MNRIRKKLASDRGASITFALLLFLVCAVLCSVIITAASTASGRMASLAETDQRYYTVTSAAELLRSLIDGQTVSVVKVEKEEVDGEEVSKLVKIKEVNCEHSLNISLILTTRCVSKFDKLRNFNEEHLLNIYSISATFDV